MVKFEISQIKPIFLLKMLHKYYKKILKNVSPREKNIFSKKTEIDSPLKVSPFQNLEVRSASLKKFNSKDLREHSPNIHGRSPLNFSAYIKRSPPPTNNKNTEKALKICQEKITNISKSLLALYETFHSALKGDEVFFFSVKFHQIKKYKN